MGHWGDAECRPRVRAKRIILAASADAEAGRSWTMDRLERAILEALEAEGERVRSRTHARLVRALERLAATLADPALAAGVRLASARLRSGAGRIRW